MKYLKIEAFILVCNHLSTCRAFTETNFNMTLKRPSRCDWCDAIQTLPFRFIMYADMTSSIKTAIRCSSAGFHWSLTRAFVNSMYTQSHCKIPSIIEVMMSLVVVIHLTVQESLSSMIGVACTALESECKRLKHWYLYF